MTDLQSQHDLHMMLLDHNSADGDKVLATVRQVAESLKHDRYFGAPTPVCVMDDARSAAVRTHGSGTSDEQLLGLGLIELALIEAEERYGRIGMLSLLAGAFEATYRAGRQA